MCKGELGIVHGIHGNEDPWATSPDDFGPGNYGVDPRNYDGIRRPDMREDDAEIEGHDLMPERGSWFGQDHKRPSLDKVLKY